MASTTTAPPPSRKDGKRKTSLWRIFSKISDRGAPRRPDQAVGDAEPRGQRFEARPLRAFADELEGHRGRDPSGGCAGRRGRSGRPLMGSNRPDVEQVEAVLALRRRVGPSDVFPADAVDREVDDLVRSSGRGPPWSPCCRRGWPRPCGPRGAGLESLSRRSAGRSSTVPRACRGGPCVRRELPGHLLAAADRPPDERGSEGPGR